MIEVRNLTYMESWERMEQAKVHCSDALPG